jgi:hypothetical protein
VMDHSTGKTGMIEGSRPSKVTDFGLFGLNKTQAGGLVHMIYKSSISKNSARSIVRDVFNDLRI